MAGNLMDRLGYELYRILCRDEVHTELFKMRDARAFLMDTADDHPEVAGCALNIERKGEKYVITQLMVDKQEYPIKNGKDAYLGRKLTADELDDSVVRFMKGQTRQNIMLDTDED